MKENEVTAALKERYSHLHPLLIHRSVERAKSNGHLFDILDTVPLKYPIVWDEKINRWTSTEDLFLSNNFTIG